MSRPTSYAPGTFAWVDLRTTDPAGAKRFYADLFGWEHTDQDEPADGRPYSVAALEGDPVAGLRPLAEAQRARGVSPFWYTYVNVESAEAAAERTRKLGGAVRAEPIDTGEGRPHWSIGHHGAAPHGRNGGVRELAPEQHGVASHWRPYFTVVSVHEALTRSAATGGAALAGPLDLPAGRTAIVRDPQGAILGILEGEAGE